MVEWFDETVGELLNHLDEQKLSDNTIVIFVIDNGWITDPKTGSYAPKSKQSQYDGGVRTPIMIRWPGHVKPQRSDSLASSLDIAPTLLTAVKLHPTPQMSGLNLLDQQAVADRKTALRRVLYAGFNGTRQPGRELGMALDDRRQMEADRSRYT